MTNSCLTACLLCAGKLQAGNLERRRNMNLLKAAPRSDSYRNRSVLVQPFEL